MKEYKEEKTTFSDGSYIVKLYEINNPIPIKNTINNKSLNSSFLLYISITYPIIMTYWFWII